MLGPLEVQKGARQPLREAVVNRGRKRKLEFFLPLEQPLQKPLVVLHSLRGIGYWLSARGARIAWSAARLIRSGRRLSVGTFRRGGGPSLRSRIEVCGWQIPLGAGVFQLPSLERAADFRQPGRSAFGLLFRRCVQGSELRLGLFPVAAIPCRY
ncbi:MAG: hypothetical protein ACOX1P_30645 [Thermoguttaceae bacterium]